MDQQYIELQTQLAFQEHVIQKLDETIIKQQKQIDMILLDMKKLQDQVKSLQQGEIMAEADEAPPPHY